MRLPLLLLCLTSPLAAQSFRSGLEGRVPAASIPVIDSLVQVAAREDLPTDPLLQKAIEGGAKQVSGERIVKAVELNLEQLRQAQALLRRAGDAPPATPAEVITIVSARKRGLADSVIERIVGALPAEPRGTALHAVADLVAHHFSGDSAADLILEAVHQGLRGVRLLDVSSAAIQETQRGHTRAEALARIRSELPHVPAPPPPPRTTVQHARRPVAATAEQPEH